MAVVADTEAIKMGTAETVRDLVMKMLLECRKCGEANKKLTKRFITDEAFKDHRNSKSI